MKQRVISLFSHLKDTANTFLLFIIMLGLAFCAFISVGHIFISFGIESSYVYVTALCLSPLLVYVVFHFWLSDGDNTDSYTESIFHYSFLSEILIIIMCVLSFNAQEKISDAYLEGYDKGNQLSDVKLENEIYEAVSCARQIEYNKGYEYGYSDGWNAHSETDCSDSSSKNTLQTKNEYRIVGVSNEDLLFWVECSIDNLHAIIDAAETDKYEYTADYIVEKAEEAIRLLSILTQLDPSEETVTVDKDTWFEIYGNIKSIETALEESDSTGYIDVDDVWGYIDNITWPDYVEYD